MRWLPALFARAPPPILGASCSSTARARWSAAGCRAPALRFLGPDGWVRATRVLRSRRSGRAHLATLATDDPLGRRLRVRLGADAEG